MLCLIPIVSAAVKLVPEKGVSAVSPVKKENAVSSLTS
jgi:hypothetical protein